jgi:hypothetical protein
LYQLVSILIDVDCLKDEASAPSASGPSPNSRRGDGGRGVAVGVGVSMGVGVGVLVAGAPEPAGPAPNPTNFATSPQRSVAVKKTVVGSPSCDFRISNAHVVGCARSTVAGIATGCPWTRTSPFLAPVNMTRVSVSGPAPVAAFAVMVTVAEIASPPTFVSLLKTTDAAGLQAAVAGSPVSGPPPRTATSSIRQPTTERATIRPWRRRPRLSIHTLNEKTRAKRMAGGASPLARVLLAGAARLQAR